MYRLGWTGPAARFFLAGFGLGPGLLGVVEIAVEALPLGGVKRARRVGTGSVFGFGASFLASASRWSNFSAP